MRFSRNVLSNPGRTDVRTTWYSCVFGFASSTAEPSSFRPMCAKFSSREHRMSLASQRVHNRDPTHGNASTQPACAAHSLRTRSPSLLIGSAAATVLVVGKVRLRLSNP